MSKKAICFGEVLWDIFPDKERIGGAPLNVASRLRAGGIPVEIISMTGSDSKGKEIFSYLEKNGVGTELLSIDPLHPTGKVIVTLNTGGSATYDISYPSAWDKIEINSKMRDAVRGADVFIYGSLVCRDEISKNTLYELLKEESYKVFDVNLRPPHYQTAVLEHLMQKANFIKFNDEELFEIAGKIGSSLNSLEQNIHFIAKKTNTQTVCVTKGRHGAVLLRDGKLYYNSGYQVKVKDTVGAGDSFLASLILGLLEKEEPQKALNYACAVGALVAGREGANPILLKEDIEKFMDPR